VTAATATVVVVNEGDERGRTKQLHKLMVQWRLRLPRKQIPGLIDRKSHVTQEEMAVLCGLAHSHYSALERGRIGNYTDATLDTFAQVARLTTSERIALYLLATGREPKPRPYAAPKITPAVIAELDCQPWPAYIINPTFDVLACNSACRAWFPCVGQETNIMRAVLCLSQVRAQLVNWEGVHAPHAIAQLRAQLTRTPGTPHHDRLKRLIREILNSSPDVRDLWATDPSVWMHEDGDLRQLQLPGATEPTTVEVLSRTPLRNPDLRTVSLIPRTGHIPADCRPHVPAQPHDHDA
jgi:transcriptional regulator with XRE-family HTH domain